MECLYKIGHFQYSNIIGEKTKNKFNFFYSLTLNIGRVTEVTRTVKEVEKNVNINLQYGEK